MLLGQSTPGETWTQTDTMYALALMQYEAGLCGGCGMPLSMTTADEDGHRLPHNYATGSFVCSGCQSLDESQADQQKSKSDPTPGEKTYLYLDD